MRCRDNSLYTGISTDVTRRFAEHQGSGSKRSKYLKGRGPLNLVFQQKLDSKSLALKAELRVKRMSKSRKEKLVEHAQYEEES
jgi:putative endonuclease